MIGMVAIVGRPNAGKSTLFNRIVGWRQAIVEPTPGVTRDRNIALVEKYREPFFLVDTGGFEVDDGRPLIAEMREQSLLAMEEADVVVCLFDGRDDPTNADAELIEGLRRSGKPIIWVVNKIDSPKNEAAATVFYELGLPNLTYISAEHGLGTKQLVTDILKLLPMPNPEEKDTEGLIKLAIVGRPNVGKSTLVNRLLKEDRVITSDVPGTTRDSIDLPFRWHDRDFILIDTAGIRRKARVNLRLEKYTVIQALKSIERADVVALLIDATTGAVEQDERILGYVQQRGKAAVMLVNKWDAVEKDDKTFDELVLDLRDQFKHHSGAQMISMSALTGKRVEKLPEAAAIAYDNWRRRIPTAELNRIMEAALKKNPPPLVRGKRLKFYYMAQIGDCPPNFVAFCNRPKDVHFSYERYLVNQLREAADFSGSPVRLIFRGREKLKKK